MTELASRAEVEPQEMLLPEKGRELRSLAKVLQRSGEGLEKMDTSVTLHPRCSLAPPTDTYLHSPSPWFCWSDLWSNLFSKTCKQDWNPEALRRLGNLNLLIWLPHTSWTAEFSKVESVVSS